MRPFGRSWASEGYGDRRPHRPDQAAARVEAVDPAADLGDEQAPVRERGVAVRAREPSGRVVGAAAAEDPDDRPVRGELDDAAVPDVRDRRVAVRETVGVVGGVQVAGRGARDARVAVAPDGAAPSKRHLRQRVVELLVGDDRAPAGSEERVVGAAERGVRPHDVPGGGDDERAVVVPVGDQQVARQRPGLDGRQAEREPGRVGPGWSRANGRGRPGGDELGAPSRSNPSCLWNHGLARG